VANRDTDRHVELVAAALALLTAGVLTATFLVDPLLADQLTRENDVVEWLQAALFAVAAALALRAAGETYRGGESPVLEILIAGVLVGLIIGELDLDRVIVGRKIISTRFLVDTEVWVGWRVLGALFVAVPPVALGLYALRRRRELIASMRRAITHPWGRVFLAGFVLFGFVEAFERPLGRVPGLPRYIVEETLELVSAVLLSVALYARSRRPTSSSS
jgi:hypothetical protein